ITIAGCAAFALGLLDRLDNYELDLQFRYLGTINSDERIVLVDINDHALYTVGDWPWPRRRYAQIVQTLSELGAEAIALDLILSEPASPRSQYADLGPHYDLDSEPIELGDRSEDPIIYDDDELRDAIADAGNVYLAMFFRLSPPGVDRKAVLGSALDVLQREPDIELQSFNTALRGTFPAVADTFVDEGFYHQVRIITLLKDDFALGASSLARKLGDRQSVSLRMVEEHLPSAKRLVAQREAEHFLEEHPDGNWREFFESVLPGASFDAETPDRNDLILAYRWQDAFRAVAKGSPPVAKGLEGRIPQAYDLTLPVEKFAKAAKGVGFVSFERERGGGVVREIPLAADASGALMLQLGLLVALDTLGIDRSSIAYERGHLSIGTGPAARRLPLTPNGLTLLNWHAPPFSRSWVDSFSHIPVTRVLEIALNTEAAAHNDKLYGLAMAELVELRHADTHAAYTDYVRLVNRRLALREQAAAADHKAGAPISRELADLEVNITRIEGEAVTWVRRAYRLWENEEPLDDTERRQRDNVRDLYAKFGEGQLAGRLESLNDKLAARTQTLLEELRPQIEGKTCLVGYTASGVADLVTSPVYSSMPGVMAHANILNMMLQDRPAVRAPGCVSLVIILASGITIAVVTCGRGPLFSLASLIVLAAVILGIGGLVFRISTYHIASMVAATQVCVVWACVTAYRQFTEERVRRHFQRALAQYTSPAVAARIAASASPVDLAPQPAQVTCFFSDLHGFTRLSEQLGAERTRLVLNPYLRAMSRVLVEHGAIINKFMGDGIFAFFNAPIWQCANHSEAACACALASLAALRDLSRQEKSAGDHEPLLMRIGISTGEVFVGDYGSDTKLDYTCIGDTVNLGARLEEANKTHGTAVLVDSVTREGAGDRFTFRSLGRIDVPGKTIAVEVHELTGWTSGVNR
ncbi:MAG: CHASE2 domain-containing protein, partial [Phycisphaerales bacterium]